MGKAPVITRDECDGRMEAAQEGLEDEFRVRDALRSEREKGRQDFAKKWGFLKAIAVMTLIGTIGTGLAWGLRHELRGADHESRIAATEETIESLQALPAAVAAAIAAAFEERDK